MGNEPVLQKLNSLHVIKRNNEKQSFDIQKIRNQIVFACKDIDVNPLELESKISLSIKNNIKTNEIQELLVHTCTTLVDVNNPEWVHVAGRLAMHQLRREIFKNTKIEYSEFVKFLQYALKHEFYRADISDGYSAEELSELQDFITAHCTLDYNKVLSQVLILKSKYLIRSNKGVLEYPLFSDMASAMILAKPYKNKVKKAKEFFLSIAKEEISLATPFKANLRIPNGNTGSCFILSVGDSLPQISKSWQDMATISSQGGGIGIYLGKLRPGGSYSYNIPKANNITLWAKIINDLAVAVNQKSKRKGAITPALDWYHKDILSFIQMKSELGGDLREKCFDLFPQVVVDDYFINAVIERKDVYLFNHYEYFKKTGTDITALVDEKLIEAHLEVHSLIEEGKLKDFEKISAVELWKHFLKIWIETGDFYIVHKDNLNMSNYLKHEAISNSANLCTESWSLNKTPTSWSSAFDAKDSGVVQTLNTDGIYHSCNLISVNVGVLLKDTSLKSACKNAVQMLDASIEGGVMPVKEALNSSNLLRNVGLGVMGVADWMAYNKLSYEKEADVLELEKLFEKIAWYTYEASIELAKDLGAYPKFKDANYSTLFGKSIDVLNTLSPNGFDWKEIQINIEQYGIRNMLLLATAPNTGSGIVCNSTASYQPPHNKFNYQTLADMSVPIVPRYLKTRFWYYKGKYQYPAEVLINVTKRLQRWIDTGISMEVLINPDLTKISTISNAVLDGFSKKELKAVYYSLTVDSTKEACTDCSN